MYKGNIWIKSKNLQDTATLTWVIFVIPLLLIKSSWNHNLSLQRPSPKSHFNVVFKATVCDLKNFLLIKMESQKSLKLKWLYLANFWIWSKCFLWTFKFHPLTMCFDPWLEILLLENNLGDFLKWGENASKKHLKMAKSHISARPSKKCRFTDPP